MKNSFEERFEKMKSASNDAPAQQQSTGMSFVVPIELVSLPSRGKFYNEGHPLKDQDAVEIKQMTAKEEDILTNKSFIKKGIVIDRLIESLLVDRSIDVSTLLVGDKNAMMVAARIAAYGPEYDVTVNCQECGNKNSININLIDIVTKDSETILQESIGKQGLEHERLQSGNIVLKLPRTGWNIECRLMTGVDERAILNLLEVKKRRDPQAEITLSEQLKFIIKAINGADDVELIHEAIDFMPAYDAKFLRNTYAKLIPNVKIEKGFTCSSCRGEQELEVPFTQEFFWPK